MCTFRVRCRFKGTPDLSWLHVLFYMKYLIVFVQPKSLFEDILSANLLIHIGKIGQKCSFQIKIGFLNLQIQNYGTCFPRITRETCSRSLKTTFFLHFPIFNVKLVWLPHLEKLIDNKITQLDCKKTEKFVISKEFFYRICYSLCHGFRLTKQDNYFWVDFDHFWIEQYFWSQLGQYWKLARDQNRREI